MTHVASSLLASVRSANCIFMNDQVSLQDGRKVDFDVPGVAPGTYLCRCYHKRAAGLIPVSPTTSPNQIRATSSSAVQVTHKLDLKPFLILQSASSSVWPQILSTACMYLLLIDLQDTGQGFCLIQPNTVFLTLIKKFLRQYLYSALKRVFSAAWSGRRICKPAMQKLAMMQPSLKVIEGSCCQSTNTYCPESHIKTVALITQHFC